MASWLSQIRQPAYPTPVPIARPAVTGLGATVSAVIDALNAVPLRSVANFEVITARNDRHRSASGHPGAYAMREIVNAILYQSRTGCQ